MSCCPIPIPSPVPAPSPHYGLVWVPAGCWDSSFPKPLLSLPASLASGFTSYVPPYKASVGN